MSDPAKLQLLTRSSEESAFDIFEIDSSQAHSGFKPQRLPETDWELMRQPLGADGTRTFVLRNLSKDRYLLLSAREHFLWQQFDGENSLEEIARAFHLEFGAFDYSLIRQFLAKLYHAQLIVGHPAQLPASHFVNPKTRSRTHSLRRLVNAWRRFAVRTHRADRFCSTLYRCGAFLLFHPLTVCLIVATAALALGAAYQLAAQSRDFARVLSARPVLSTGVMLVTLLTASMLHVLVHALACKAHGRRVREMGFFLLQGVLPTFYADVTDIFMSNRRARLAVDFAGPMVEVALGSFAILGALLSNPGFAQALLFGVGILLWESALINLYPFSFLELDGYNILADTMAMPMLRKQALALIPELPQCLLRWKTIRRAELIQIGYLALCLISVLIYLILHLDAVSAVVSLPWEKSG
jgi:putative peptide zinc metalloprotease protein